MVQAASNLYAQTFSPNLAERLGDAELSGDIPASEEATSFSIAQRFSPPAFTEGVQASPGSRSWRWKTFTALLVLGSLAPSVLIGSMFWFGTVKAPSFGVVVDRFRNDPAEGKKVATTSTEPETSTEPKISQAKPATVERPLVVMTVPNTLQALLGRETPFVITIDSTGPLPPRTVVTVNGMPEAATFSLGRPYGPTGWTLRPDETSNLRLIPSKTGNADLQIDLVTAEGVNIASAATHVDIMTDPKPTLVSRPDETARVDDLLAHARKMVEVGYIAGARGYYRRAAEAGSADAALALGDTYDPAFLDSIRAHGIKPDLAQARTWYERARNLGSEEAKAKLGRFPKEEYQPVQSHP